MECWTIITSLLNLQSRQVQERKSNALFEEARTRVQSMAIYVSQFTNRSRSLLLSSLPYTRRLVSEVLKSYGAQERIQAHVSGDISLELQRAIPFALLMNELLSNVSKHAFPSGERGPLSVRLTSEDSTITLTLAGQV